MGILHVNLLVYAFVCEFISYLPLPSLSYSSHSSETYAHCGSESEDSDGSFDGSDGEEQDVPPPHSQEGLLSSVIPGTSGGRDSTTIPVTSSTQQQQEAAEKGGKDGEKTDKQGQSLCSTRAHTHTTVYTHTYIHTRTRTYMQSPT